MLRIVSLIFSYISNFLQLLLFFLKSIGYLLINIFDNISIKPKRLKFNGFISGFIFSTIIFFTPILILSWYSQLPSTDLLSELGQNRPTKILDRNGKLLYEIYLEKKYDPVTLDKIPDAAIKATLAIEDSEFYSHKGIRPLSIIRAAKASVIDDNLQGASTITQQLVKNILLTPERSIQRKIKEVVLTILAEQKYSKDEILELYLNNISYGGVAWGIQSASKEYFGKYVWELNLAESAMLAGLPTAPSIYAPTPDDMELAKKRQKLVLDKMVELKYITDEDAKIAYDQQLNILPKAAYIRAPHFVNYIKDELVELYGKRYVESGGLTVYTSLDLDIQDKVQEIVRTEIENSKKLNINNGAALVLDSKNNEILSYVGSKDYFENQYGTYDIIRAYRQPGSAVKPITYALAFSKGYSPASTISDEPFTYKNQWETYSPVNYDGKYHGTVTLRTALANSYNIPAVKLISKVGAYDMVSLGHDMGLTNWDPSNDSYGLSVTLGGKEVRLLDLTNVYASFSRGGIYKNIKSILSIKDSRGFEIYNPHFNLDINKQVLKPEVSYLITNILSDSKARLPAFGVNNFLTVTGHEVAVKTGTTDLKRDNYTFGYTPSYTVGVWVGNNNNVPMNKYLASGLSGAAPIWNKIMSFVLDKKPKENFSVPANVVMSKENNCNNDLYIQGLSKYLSNCDPLKDKSKSKS